MTFDASVTEPCAYHIGLDQTWAGAGPAEYLAEQLGGKGSIIVMGGYPGHYIDHARTDGAMEVFSQYPEISILVHAYSNWNNAHARQELTKIVATHGWDNIDGLWTQVGCYMLSQIQVEAGRADQLVPCAGNGTNGHRIAIAEPGSVPGALGMKSSSMGSPTWLGAYALKIAVAYADGGAEPPRFTQVPMPLVEPGQVVVCTEGTREELLERNCNTYHPDLGVPAELFRRCLASLGQRARPVLSARGHGTGRSVDGLPARHLPFGARASGFRTEASAGPDALPWKRAGAGRLHSRSSD